MRQRGAVPPRFGGGSRQSRWFSKLFINCAILAVALLGIGLNLKHFHRGHKAGYTAAPPAAAPLAPVVAPLATPLPQQPIPELPAAPLADAASLGVPSPLVSVTLPPTTMPPSPAPTRPTPAPTDPPTPIYVLQAPNFDVEEFCGLLAQKAPKALPHGTRLAFRVNYRPAWKCGNSSMGNMLSIHIAFRTLALLAGADYQVGRSCKGRPESLQAFLPTFVPSTKPPNLAAARDSCTKCRTNSAHICTSGWPQVARQIVPGDIRAAVAHYEAASATALQHDDVAIHLRCGDTFKIKNPGIAAQYGMLPYSHYHRIIPANVSSIGINCQSLNPNCASWAVRKGDCEFGIVEKCRGIVEHLADHLRTQYPNAVVTIRDGEPVARTYSRLVNAPIATICNPSTFCLWPTIASRNGWLPNTKLFRGAQLASQGLDSVHMLHPTPQFLTYQQMQRMKTSAITEILARR